MGACLTDLTSGTAIYELHDELHMAFGHTYSAVNRWRDYVLKAIIPGAGDANHLTR